MKVRSAAAVAGVVLGLMSGTAQASYVYTAEQVGNNVVITGSGSLDLTGFSSPTNGSGVATGYVSSNTTALGIGFSGSASTTYNVTITGQDPFSSGGTYTNADVNTGNFVAFNLGGVVVVPEGYMSGGMLGSSSSTFDGTTFATLGLKTGSFTIDLPNDTIIVNVGTVPLPASAPMFGAALMALGTAGYMAKRRKAAATA